LASAAHRTVSRRAPASAFGWPVHVLLGYWLGLSRPGDRSGLSSDYRLAPKEKGDVGLSGDRDFSNRRNQLEPVARSTRTLPSERTKNRSHLQDKALIPSPLHYGLSCDKRLVHAREARSFISLQLRAGYAPARPYGVD
jgi:hypothetical protein